MGLMIKAKFGGSCKMCGDNWAVGEEIYYQTSPKALCISKGCFTEQGGDLNDSRKPAFSMKTDSRNIIITNVPNVKISDDTRMIGELWKQYFREAHELTKETYPQEDVNSDRFGMIRQTVLNQLVNMAGVVVNKNKD